MVLRGSQCIEISAFAIRYYIFSFHIFFVYGAAFSPRRIKLFVDPFALAANTRQRSKFRFFCVAYSRWECSQQNLITCYDPIPFSRVRRVHNALISPVSYW